MRVVLLDRFPGLHVVAAGARQRQTVCGVRCARELKPRAWEIKAGEEGRVLRASVLCGACGNAMKETPRAAA